MLILTGCFYFIGFGFHSMMKVFVVLLGCVLVGQTMGKEDGMRKQYQDLLSSSYFSHVTRTSALNNSPKFNACPLCIDFADECLQMLEDLVLDITVFDSCQVICDALATKTKSRLLGVMCNFLCDIAGGKEFVKALKTLDLDDIYFCELIGGCPIFDQGDAKITELSISPVTGPVGGKRIIDFSYVSKNGTGTGQLELRIITVDKFPFDDRLLNEAGKPGTYPFRFELDLDPNCQVPCERWPKGNYTLIVSVCDGECGSKHPHSKVYDSRSVNFTVTKKHKS